MAENHRGEKREVVRREMEGAVELQDVGIPRYVRVVARVVGGEDAAALESRKAAVSVSGANVVEFAHPFFFFSMPRVEPLMRCPKAREGRWTGVDAASAAAVSALRVGEIAESPLLLDLCCAPGVKLSMASELLWRQRGGSIVGVDCSLRRLFACGGLLRRLRVKNTLLLHHDGTTIAREDVRRLVAGAAEVRPKRRCRRGEARGETPTSGGRVFHRGAELCESSLEKLHVGFDAVLVDAECTCDGSLAHVGTTHARYKPHAKTNTSDGLPQLQLQLLANALSLLRPGGVLVYSTCTLRTQQNEAVVECFLERWNGAVELQRPFQESEAWYRRCQWCGPQLRCARFSPEVSQTSVQFVARFLKSAPINTDLRG